MAFQFSAKSEQNFSINQEENISCGSRNSSFTRFFSPIFYKGHFYKQRHAEIGRKSGKS